MTMTIKKVDDLRKNLQKSFDMLIKKIGPIPIGSPRRFPYGWRKAAKGRTVWRIVEEIITQNLEKYHNEFNIDDVQSSESEVTVYDMKCEYENMHAYVNIKSAVVGGKSQKDDISKADGLMSFYKKDVDKQFFAATFFIRFNKNMTIEITKALVFPVAWIPDIYVNPSNNNLQSAHYKNLDKAVKKTNRQFIKLLQEEMKNASKKKQNKNKGS